MEKSENKGVIDITFSSVLKTSKLLGIIADFDSVSKDYINQLSVKNPRIFGMLVDATILRLHVENGESLF